MKHTKIIFLSFFLTGLPSNAMDQEFQLPSRKSSNLSLQQQIELNKEFIATCYEGSLDQVESLLQAGAEVNAHDNFLGGSALILAAGGKQKEICSLLLEQGADISAQSGYKWTALDIASSLALNEDNEELLKEIITKPLFTPVIPEIEYEFEPAYHRILTALLIFKKLCPHMPKDVRKLILCADPRLKFDLLCSGAFHRMACIRPEMIPNFPLPVLARLINRGTLEAQTTIIALKKNHYARIMPLIKKTITTIPDEELQKLANQELLEDFFDVDIENTIRTRLNLPLLENNSDENSAQESSNESLQSPRLDKGNHEYI